MRKFRCRGRARETGGRIGRIRRHGRCTRRGHASAKKPRGKGGRQRKRYANQLSLRRIVGILIYKIPLRTRGDARLMVSNHYHGIVIFKWKAQLVTDSRCIGKWRKNPQGIPFSGKRPTNKSAVTIFIVAGKTIIRYVSCDVCGAVTC